MNIENEEIWCPVKGYEGYEVSDQGRVRSLKWGKERILSTGRTKDGYLLVYLCKNGEMKKCRIHRLVAQAFIPNPDNLPQVNHKDEDKTNNSAQNLEWCDQKYNNTYGTRIQRVAEKLKKLKNGKCSKPVLQYTLDGKFVREWKSTMDVQRNLGYSRGRISDCCRGERKSAYNYIWKYKG